MPHSRPAQKRECGVIDPGVLKNGIRSTEVNFTSPHLVFATLPSARMAIYTRYGLSMFFPPKVRNILICNTEKSRLFPWVIILPVNSSARKICNFCPLLHNVLLFKILSTSLSIIIYYYTLLLFSNSLVILVKAEVKKVAWL